MAAGAAKTWFPKAPGLWRVQGGAAKGSNWPASASWKGCGGRALTLPHPSPAAIPTRIASARLRTPSRSHHRRPVRLHRAGADPQFPGDHLVRLPGDQRGQHLALPRRQILQPRCRKRALRLGKVVAPGSVQRIRHRRQDLAREVGLLDEVDRPRPHRPHRERHVRVPGDDHHGNGNPEIAPRQFLLQRQPVHAGTHPDVDDGAGDRARPVLSVGERREKGLRRRIGLDMPPPGPQQLRQGPAHRVVVVHDEDQRPLARLAVVHALRPRWTGLAAGAG